MTKIKTILQLLILIFCLIGCQGSTTEEDDVLNGRITFWHDGTAAQSAVMESAINTFKEANPQTEVVNVLIPREQLLDEFKYSAEDGLAPDLFIGPSEWLPELVGAGLIRPFQPIGSNLTLERYDSLTSYQGVSYGLPFSLSPIAIYYNKTLVEEPPTNLDDLLAEARKGNRIGIVPRFTSAYWGIPAFGQGLFDADGNFTLAESGFTEWLTWLKSAQPIASVILSGDETSLREIFIEGDMHYYVAGAEEQSILAERMAQDSFGVAPLPDGPFGPAGPLLPAEIIMFYAHSSDEQARTANALAQFLASQQQSNNFMRELEIIPANPTVRVDPRLYPNVAGFARQARSAVVLPNDLDKEKLYAAGNKAYTDVLSNLVTPEEAVCAFGQNVAAMPGMAARKISLPEGCELPVVESNNS